MVLRNKEIKKIDKLTKKCDFHGFTCSNFRLQKSSVSLFLSFSTSLRLQMIFSGFCWASVFVNAEDLFLSPPEEEVLRLVFRFIIIIMTKSNSKWPKAKLTCYQPFCLLGSAGGMKSYK